jgi:DNA-binding winged helix-turn-helix (wHTH) protein
VYLGDTTPVQLTPMPYRVVLCLYEGEGFVPKREISKTVWNDEYTTDATIRQHISHIRKALEEAGANPDHYIVNQIGRGYKLQNTA